MITALVRLAENLPSRADSDALSMPPASPALVLILMISCVPSLAAKTAASAPPLGPAAAFNLPTAEASESESVLDRLAQGELERRATVLRRHESEASPLVVTRHQRLFCTLVPE